MRVVRKVHPRHMKHPALLFTWRAFRNGWHNVRRNTMLSAATVLIIALMFFVFNMILAISLATDSVLLSLGQKVDVRVEFAEGAETYARDSLIRELSARPEVLEVVFVPREDALARLGGKYPNILSFLEQNRLNNPLPDVARIVTREIEANETLLAFLAEPRFAHLIAQNKLKTDVEERQQREKILNITHFLKRMGGALHLTFALTTLLVLFNSISLTVHAHRQEIAVMRLVGAKRRFIRAGYLFEGLFYALAALLLSFLLSRLTVLYLTKNLLGVITNENLLMGLNAVLLHFGDRLALTFAWQFFAAAALGLLSSFLAIEIYLRQRHVP